MDWTEFHVLEACFPVWWCWEMVEAFRVESSGRWLGHDDICEEINVNLTELGLLNEVS
jgi:hypothetical protein